MAWAAWLVMRSPRLPKDHHIASLRIVCEPVRSGPNRHSKGLASWPRSSRVAEAGGAKAVSDQASTACAPTIGRAAPAIRVRRPLVCPGEAGALTRRFRSAARIRTRRRVRYWAPASGPNHGIARTSLKAVRRATLYAGLEPSTRFAAVADPAR